MSKKDKIVKVLKRIGKVGVTVGPTVVGVFNPKLGDVLQKTVDDKRRKKIQEKNKKEAEIPVEQVFREICKEEVVSKTDLTGCDSCGKLFCEECSSEDWSVCQECF